MSSGPYHLLILLYGVFLSTVLLANLLAHALAAVITHGTRKRHVRR